MPKPLRGSRASRAGDPDCSTSPECSEGGEGWVKRLHRVLEVAEVAQCVGRSLVAHQSSQLGWQRAGNLDRTGQVLVLLLPQPAQRVADVDAEAIGLAAVGTASVVHGSDVEQYRTLR